MKKILLFTALAIGALCAPSAAQNRIVENPLIEYVFAPLLDIPKIELSDTATVLHFRVYSQPQSPISIRHGAYLRADGQEFALRGAEGIAPDSTFRVPDSGEMAFKLTFDPLPSGAKSFDFIEAEPINCFKIIGVDLTGKKEYPLYHDDLPAVLRKEPKEGPVPDPVLKMAETTLNVHILGFREGMPNRIGYNSMSLLGEQNEYAATIDPKSGMATFRFLQSGTVQGEVELTDFKYAADIWTIPGETIDVYLDLREFGKFVINKRNKIPPQRVNVGYYSTGTYGDLNHFFNNMNRRPITLNSNSDLFWSYKMSADECLQVVESKYKTLADSISRSDMPEQVKEILHLSLQQEIMNAAARSKYLLETNYRFANNMWDSSKKIDYQFAEFTPEQIARICRLFDIDNPKLQMGMSLMNYLSAVAGPLDLPQVAGATVGFISDLRKVCRLSDKINYGELSQTDLDQIPSLHDPAFVKIIETKIASTRAELEKDVKIEQTPAVTDDQLFDAIIAPYKGKVIFVDFWNTWCRPCKAAIAQTEPLKNVELKSDDLVWIYIADDSSPLTTYKTSIPKIQGKHFRLNQVQMQALKAKFKFNGIPAYVLVEKDGTYSLRNDFRNHDLVKSILLEKIK